MSQRQGPAGPQFRADRPIEQEAVRTTIVGGRPPGSGKPVGNIPQGIEVLIRKASVDAEFRAALLDRRAAAAEDIGLALDAAEAMMLRAVPREQLEAIIARTNVPEEHRRAFLGQAAAAMLATVGMIRSAYAAAPERILQAPGGVAPDRVPPKPAPKTPTVEERVKAVLARELKADEKRVTRPKSLVRDLGAKSPDLVRVRKALDQEFKLTISADDFKKLQSVGQVIDHVEASVKKSQESPSAKPPQPPVSRGIQPDVPPVAGGVRPDRPPTATRGGTRPE